MSWHVPVVFYLITEYAVAPVFIKKITGLPSRTRRLRILFGVCAILSVAAMFAMRTSLIADYRLAMVLGLGIANSLACYARWRAMDVSMSKTALFTFMDDVISMALASAVLDEHRLFTNSLAFGVIMCVVGAILNARLDARAKAEKEIGTPPWHIFVWIGIYSIIWGTASFAFRASAVSGIPLVGFLIVWYVGSFIGSNLVMLIMGKKEKGEPLTRRGVAGIFLLALASAVSLALNYWASMEAPVAVTQPIFQVAEMIIPALIGLLYFKEIKELGGAKKLVFAIAFLGSLIIAISY